MKLKRKLLSALMCVCLVFCMFTGTAMADEPTGSITIQNPTHSDATVGGKTFNVYKVFDATTDGTSTSYSWYEENDGAIPFYDFFYGASGVVGENVVDGNVQGAVNYVGGIKDGSFELSQFAESMHVYINGKNTDDDPSNNIAPIATQTVDSNATIASFADLTYGYYLVYDATDLTGEKVSAVRSAVMLTTVNKDAVITLKANRPQVDKTVLENDGETWGKGTSSTVGDVITFKITTLIPSHTLYTKYHYSISDKMPDGLSLNASTIKVYKESGEPEKETDDILLTENTHYTLQTSATGFVVDFTNGMNTFSINDEIYIKYDATLNENAKKHQSNEAILIYSNDPTIENSRGSVSDSVNIYSYQFVFTKFSQDANGNFMNVRLSGAEFELYQVENSTETLLHFTTETKTNTEGSAYTLYTVATQDEINDVNIETTTTLSTHPTGDKSITLDHLNYGGHLGDVAIFGLAEGTYRLVEKTAPAGHVLPAEPFEIVIEDTIGVLGVVGTLDVSGNHTGTGSIVNTKGMAESILTVWAEITNKPGSALPETGGMGTSLFMILGVVIMAGAVSLFLVRRKRTA